MPQGMTETCLPIYTFALVMSYGKDILASLMTINPLLARLQVASPNHHMPSSLMTTSYLYAHPSRAYSPSGIRIIDA